MPLRIAFDLDGVLADLSAALNRLSEQLFGVTRPDGADRAHSIQAVAEPVPQAGSPEIEVNGSTSAGDSAPAEAGATETAPGDDVVLPSLSTLTARQQRELWRTVREADNFWETLDEIEPGTIARLGALAQAHRWEVIFVTERPSSAGDTVQVQTQRWLERHGFRLPSVFVLSSGSRGKVAAALGLEVVVDDRVDNCFDVKVESKARSILVWRGAEGSVPLNARRLGIEVVPSMEPCLNLLAGSDAPAGNRTGMVGRIKRLFTERG